MKKVLFMVLISSVSYANHVATMLPAERENLFISTVEVADAYQEVGKTSKANSFYRSAVSIYPVGDLAHRVAVKQGMTLDDDVTYSNFVQEGTKAFNAGKYDVSVASFLMANELDNSPELYQKIAEAYAMLGDRVKADHYNDLVVQSSYATVVSSTPDEVDEIIIIEDDLVFKDGELVEEIITIDDIIIKDGDFDEDFDEDVVEETVIIEDIIY